MKLPLVFLMICMQGCNSIAPMIELNSGGASVRLIENKELPEACQELATVEVKHGSGCGGYGKEGSLEGASNLFRNHVFKEGGNAGVIQSKVPPHAIPFCDSKEFKIRGFAFDCPPDAQ